MTNEEKAKIRAEIIMSLKKGYKPKLIITAVESLSQELEKGIRGGDAWLELLEQAKELESKQQKDMFIGGYTSHAMKGNKLPYGLEWLTKIAEIEEEAEELYDQHFKSK
tara:strand:+ start:863 stop:1189 length:327 start_codon:yes stop_codon:yes gene_type:complete